MKHIATGLVIICILWLQACSSSHLVTQAPLPGLASEKDLLNAHVGICVYDPERNQFLYSFQADKYFVPASNTKLFTLYAGMKWLGDSLEGIRYIERDTSILILPTGDPTLLHPDFSKQPVIDFLQKSKKNIYIADANWQETPLGSGWAWDDYNESYMAERSSMPVYGNVIQWVEEQQQQEPQNQHLEQTPVIYSLPEVNWKVRFTTDTSLKSFFVKRKKEENLFEVTEGSEKFKSQRVPFVTNGLSSALELLKDTIGKPISLIEGVPAFKSRYRTIRSQPADSMFRPMMARSDNFFAEQTLLMVANDRLGVMSERLIIDTLLKAELTDLPQRPNWVDGSGLSRYNLFTPLDFIWILNRLRNEFGMDRMKSLLLTGGRGLLANYYKNDSGLIFAKTGSFSGVVALSGYLFTQKKRLLLFSILVNNHQGDPVAIRKDIESFLEAVRKDE